MARGSAREEYTVLYHEQTGKQVSERVRGPAPFESYPRLTLLGALSSEGLLGPRSTTAATDTPVFPTWRD